MDAAADGAAVSRRRKKRWFSTNFLDFLSMTMTGKTSWHGAREPYRCGVSTGQNSAMEEAGSVMLCAAVVGVVAVAGWRGSRVGLGFRVFPAVRLASSFFDIYKFRLWLASLDNNAGKRKIRAADPKADSNQDHGVR